MKTWNEKTKKFWIETMQAHQDADRLTQGIWWNPGSQKGCFFGCAMANHLSEEYLDEDYGLGQAAEAMQLPEWLVILAEPIFEGLRRSEALMFPVEFCKAVPCDVELDEAVYDDLDCDPVTTYIEDRDNLLNMLRNAS